MSKKNSGAFFSVTGGFFTIRKFCGIPCTIFGQNSEIYIKNKVVHEVLLLF